MTGLLRRRAVSGKPFRLQRSGGCVKTLKINAGENKNLEIQARFPPATRLHLTSE